MDSRGIYGGIRGIWHKGIDTDKEQKAGTGTYFPDWHRVAFHDGIRGAIFGRPFAAIFAGFGLSDWFKHHGHIGGYSAGKLGNGLLLVLLKRLLTTV